MAAPIAPAPRPARSRARRRSAVAGGAGVALLVAAAPATAAPTTTKAKGTTTIKLSSSITKVLKRDGVKMSGVSPARRGSTTLKLPLSSATIDAAAGSGTLNHSGAVRFSRRGRSTTFKSFQVAVDQGSARVTVKIGSSSVRAFDVDLSKLKVKQTSKTITLSGLKVTMTAVGASRVNRALKVKRFRRGTVLGVASAVVDAASLGGSGSGSATGTVLKGGTTTLSLTDAAKAALAGSGATLGTVAPATGSGTGPFAFPITGGQVDGSRRFAGSVSLAGALTATSQGQTVTFTDPIVDTAGSKITAVAQGQRIELFSLDLSTLKDVGYESQLVLGSIVVKQARSGPLGGDSQEPLGTLRIDATTK